MTMPNCSISIYKQMLEQMICSNITPSLGCIFQGTIHVILHLEIQVQGAGTWQLTKTLQPENFAIGVPE